MVFLADLTHLYALLEVGLESGSLVVSLEQVWSSESACQSMCIYVNDDHLVE